MDALRDTLRREVADEMRTERRDSSASPDNSRELEMQLEKLVDEMEQVGVREA